LIDGGRILRNAIYVVENM